MREKTSLKWHSYFGVIIGFFILMAALSGSVIAFYHTLDAKINPWQISSVPLQHDTVPTDPLDHIRQIEAKMAGAKVSWISLSLSHESSWHYFLAPKSMKNPIENNEVYVDPYSGEIKGMRLWGSLSQGITNLLPFIYKIHYALALGSIGTMLMGFAALLWLVVLVCGLWITFPRWNAQNSIIAFFTQWKKSWAWRFKGNFRTKNYLLHKVAGLWLLPFLIILAWSSVSFNLHEFHEKVLGSMLQMQSEYDKIKELKKPRLHPKLTWAEARETGRELMQALATKEGFTLVNESSLSYNSLKGIYTYKVQSSRDIEIDHGATSVYFDGNTGAYKASFVPTGKASGDTLNAWLEGLHKGSIWGLPHRIVLSLLGVITALFAVSGYYLWWKRKKTVKNVTKK